MALSNRNNLGGGGGVSPSGEYVEVTADGSKTIRQLLNELFTNIDFSKIKPTSLLVIYESAETRPFRLYSIGSNSLIFNSSWQNVGGSWYLWQFTINASTSTLVAGTNGVGADSPNTIYQAGSKLRLFY